jgi:small subunit ribosomal protein S16
MRRVVIVGLAAGAVVTVVVIARRRAAPAPVGVPDWAPLRLVEPAAAPATVDDAVAASGTVAASGAVAATDPPATKWVDPDGQGRCPDSHPIKGNRASRIYHVPGGRYYDSTHAERCFCDGDAAEADGYRASKR